MGQSSTGPTGTTLTMKLLLVFAVALIGVVTSSSVRCPRGRRGCRSMMPKVGRNSEAVVEADADGVDGVNLGDYFSYEKIDAKPYLGRYGYKGWGKRSAEEDVDGGDLGDELSYEKRDAEPWGGPTFF